MCDINDIQPNEIKRKVQLGSEQEAESFTLGVRGDSCKIGYHRKHMQQQLTTKAEQRDLE